MIIKTLFLAAVIAISLASCRNDQEIAKTDFQVAKHLCSSTAVRVISDAKSRPYTELLATECWHAAHAAEAESDTITSWYAVAFMNDLSKFEAALDAFDHPPSRYGEYLIANEIGLNRALDAWIISRQSAAARIQRGA
jgi:hypothetical protein